MVDSNTPKTGKRTLAGLLVALVAAAVMWWTQGDGSHNQPEPEPTPSAQTQPTTQPTSAAPTSEAPTASPTQTISASPTNSASPTTSASPTSGATDPDSGLPFVQVDQLPVEARETLDLIDAGGPFPYDRDGVTFENRERILPDQPRGYYHEYTVETPGSYDRGARRIVVGDGGEFYWTEDHYDSFERIAR